MRDLFIKIYLLSRYRKEKIFDAFLRESILRDHRFLILNLKFLLFRY